MRSSDRHTAGARFVWYDLMSCAVEESASFYSKVLNWDAQLDQHDPPLYAILWAANQRVGAVIAAHDQHSVGNRWLPYLGVADLDRFVDRALRLGGRTPLPDVAESGRGRFAVILDPGGAVFAACELTTDDDVSASSGPPGTFGWQELATDQPKQMSAFYLELCGWTLSAEPSAGLAPYWFFADDRVPVGGITPQAAVNTLQPIWLCQVQIEDVARTADQAVAQGGELLVEPTTAPAIGRRALIADPFGGVLGVVRPAANSVGF